MDSNNRCRDPDLCGAFLLRVVEVCVQNLHSRFQLRVPDLADDTRFDFFTDRVLWYPFRRRLLFRRLAPEVSVLEMSDRRIFPGS